MIQAGGAEVRPPSYVSQGRREMEEVGRQQWGGEPEEMDGREEETEEVQVVMMEDARAVPFARPNTDLHPAYRPVAVGEGREAVFF